MTQLQTAPAVGDLTHRQILRVFAGLMTAAFLAALDQTVVATALPTIVGDLGGLSQLSWVVTAYLVTSTVSVPLYGKLSDLHGRRRMYAVALGVFLAGSLASGLAGTMGQLIAARSLQGVGAGGLMAMAQAVIGDVVAPRQRGRYMGYMGGAYALASVTGPLLGGAIVDTLHWRWIFLVNLPVGAAALWLTQRNLRLGVPRRERRIDYAGAALLTGAVVALLLVSVWGGATYPWGSPVILGLVLLAAVALGAFVAVETRAPEPILPLELFRDRVVAVAAGLLVCTGMVLFGGIVALPLFMQAVLGLSATRSGLLLLPLVGGLLVAVVGTGRLISRRGRYRAFPIAGAALLAAGVALLSAVSAETSAVQVGLSLAVVGLGIGPLLQVPLLALQNAVPARHLGAGTSTALLARSMGGAAGVALFGALLNARLAAGLALPDAIPGIFRLALGVIAVAFVLACLLREIPLRTRAGSAL